MKKNVIEKIASIIEDLKDDLNDLEQVVGDVEEANEEERGYPYVGRSNIDQILLFTSPRNGVLLNNKHQGFGYESDYWYEENFRPFTGTIRYKNGQPIETEVSK